MPGLAKRIVLGSSKLYDGVYDTFTRIDGAIGNTEGKNANGKRVRRYPWTGATWTISTNKAVNTPTAGGEIVVNGTMEADSNWNNFSTPATNERSNIQAHAGTYSRHFIQDAAYEGVNSDAFSVVVGTWYCATGWIYRTDIGADYDSTIMSFRQAIGTVLATATYKGSRNAWKQLTATGRAAASVATGLIAFYTGTATGQCYIDDASVKPLTLATLLASIDASNANVVASINITFDADSAVQAGLVLCLDSAASPDNFILVYYSRHDGKIYIDKKTTAGGYANVAATTTTYSAGATLQVTKSGTTVTVVYNGSAVGTPATISDAGIISNTLHGLFSTGSATQVQLDTFSRV